MDEGAQSFGFDVLLLIGAGVVLGAASLGIRSVLQLVPISKARREALSRATPVVAVLVALLYAMFAVRTLFQNQPKLVPVVVAMVLAGFVVASWGALRDVLSGVFLRAGRVLEVGDHVRLDDLGGRIKRLGYRVLVLETAEGDEAIVPYSTIARERLIRTPVLDGAAAHVFTVDLPEGAPLADVKRTIHQSALLVHWSAPSREPEVASGEGAQLEVTVFAVHPDRGPEIEAAVRRALRGAPASGERVGPAALAESSAQPRAKRTSVRPAISSVPPPGT